MEISCYFEIFFSSLESFMNCNRIFFCKNFFYSDSPLCSVTEGLFVLQKPFFTVANSKLRIDSRLFSLEIFIFLFFL